ncbi:sulfurtransferase [Corynebacterium aquatimens]|uniref:thiosulfate sulfurtransferase n=1 Tax=Corynebacterium aquatimens TaxID=1190508 RepID=A0A931GSJ1_9CORY|nr:sulfurtransferase [Corynebacterium aquatimens]MBG6123118.1 thiosulfate/3-mercaptopyruvate sulfurtransferase [Corynebacterium aquatimens]WJY66550.1 Putative thiosulfate sulfurtransferase SseA [Corynebacterium aquatimens]
MGIELDPYPQFQEYAHPEKFVSASWLSARLGTPGLSVVESDADSFLYDIGHIPGAVRINWHKDLNDDTVRDFIDGEGFAALMDSKGITRDDTVVLYGDQNNWWAAYTAWVFELFGHPDVRLLDGGRDAWMAEERDTSYAVPEKVTEGYPVVKRAEAPLRAYVDDVRAGGATLIDVRGPEFFSGHEGDLGESSGGLRSGHIPGAVNYPWGAAVHPNGRFKDRAAIAAAFEGIDLDNRLITYCGAGQSAAHTWFTLRYVLGAKQPALYDGSWCEWGNMVRVPIEKSPN